jgi:hypothetical protein
MSADEDENSGPLEHKAEALPTTAQCSLKLRYMNMQFFK